MILKINKSLILLFLIKFLFPGFSYGQNQSHSMFKNTTGFLKHEKLSVIGNIGLSTYYGDLCDKFSCAQFRPNFGLGAIWRFNKHFASKIEANYVKLYSKDVYPDRNLNFRSGNFEVYAAGIYEYFPYTKHFRKRKLVEPYLFAGIGFVTYNPKGMNDNGEWIALRPLRTEGQATEYSSVALIIPLGAGITIKYSKHLSFMLEGGYRITTTDYLDDVSSFNYENLDNLPSPEAKELALKSPDGTTYKEKYLSQQRGNPTKNDGYFVLNAKVKYTLGAKHNHFRGKHPLLKPHHK